MTTEQDRALFERAITYRRQYARRPVADYPISETMRVDGQELTFTYPLKAAIRQASARLTDLLDKGY
jgi:hypothetical protein